MRLKHLWGHQFQGVLFKKSSLLLRPVHLGIKVPAWELQAGSSPSVLWQGSGEEEGAESGSAPTSRRTLEFAAPCWWLWEAQRAEELA